MANILNINAESGANIIGDDTTPALTLENTGGPGLEARSAVLVSTASIDAADVGALTADTARPVSAANATLVAFNFVGSSIASGAVMGFLNLSAMVSASTLNIGAAAANSCAAIRVVRPNGTFGWIPVLADAAVSGIAV